MVAILLGLAFVIFALAWAITPIVWRLANTRVGEALIIRSGLLERKK